MSSERALRQILISPGRCRSPTAMAGTSVQAAHDALLATKPADASHPADCPLCQKGAGASEKAGEVTPVGDADPRFTEEQVQRLVDSAVAKETASLQTQIDTLSSEKAAAETRADGLSDQLAAVEAEKAELTTRIEVVESEKAAAESARDAVTGEFETFKAGLAEIAAVSERKASRAAEVAAAAPHLDDAFIADEARQTRWAEMAEEQFEAVLVAFRESASAALTPAEREVVEKASDKSKAMTEVFAARHGAVTTTQVRETASFSGGDQPTAKDKPGEPSTLNRFFASAGRRPVSA